MTCLGHRAREWPSQDSQAGLGGGRATPPLLEAGGGGWGELEANRRLCSTWELSRVKGFRVSY